MSMLFVASLVDRELLEIMHCCVCWKLYLNWKTNNNYPNNQNSTIYSFINEINLHISFKNIFIAFAEFSFRIRLWKRSIFFQIRIFRFASDCRRHSTAFKIRRFFLSSDCRTHRTAFHIRMFFCIQLQNIITAFQMRSFYLRILLQNRHTSFEILNFYGASLDEKQILYIWKFEFSFCIPCAHNLNPNNSLCILRK